MNATDFLKKADDELERQPDSWIVGVGGSPKDSWDKYYTEEEAEEACLEMAKEMAEHFRQNEGKNVEEIYLYDSDEYEGGACPDGEGGEYWPVYEPE